jgi:hypothetical protein
MPSTGSGYAKIYQSSNSHPALYMANAAGTATIVLNSSGVSYLTSGNIIIGGTADNGNLLQVQGTGYFLGNVGIGTASPLAKLDVRRGSSGIVAEFHSTQGVADEYVDIKLISGNTTAGTYGTILRHQRAGTGGGDFAVLTNQTLTSTPVERMRITSAGNVGIGTSGSGGQARGNRKHKN